LPTQVGTALSRKAVLVHLHNVLDILRRRKTARHIDVVVVPAQEEIVAEVEVLLFAMAGDLVWKTARATRARADHLLAMAIVPNGKGNVRLVSGNVLDCPVLPGPVAPNPRPKIDSALPGFSPTKAPTHLPNVPCPAAVPAAETEHRGPRPGA
jgi:hypothetical protein